MASTECPDGERNFTVEGIGKMQHLQEAQDAAEHERVKLVKNRASQLAKAQERSAKKAEKDKEEAGKKAESRLKRIIQIKVERRFEAFPWLKDKVPPLSKNASLEELQETDEAQKLEMDLQGGEKRVAGYIKTGAIMLESFWGDGSELLFLPADMCLNLTNLSKTVSSPMFQEELKPLITETVIEYPWLCQANLPMRWGQAIFRCLLAVHLINMDRQSAKTMLSQLKNMPAANFRKDKVTSDSKNTPPTPANTPDGCCDTDTPRGSGLNVQESLGH